MKITLSMPNTSSSAVSVASAIQAWGSVSSSVMAVSSWQAGRAAGDSAAADAGGASLSQSAINRPSRGAPRASPAGLARRKHNDVRRPSRRQAMTRHLIVPALRSGLLAAWLVASAAAGAAADDGVAWQSAANNADID